MADPVSLAASIIAILQLTSSVVQYITDVSGGQEERLSLRNEISSAYGPLRILHDRIIDEQKRLSICDGDDAEHSWLSSVMDLGAAKGPLEQYAEVLKALQKENERFMNSSKTDGKKIIAMGKSLAWPFKKNEIERYMRIVERQRSMFFLALQNDNLSLALAIKEDTSLLPKMVSDLADVADVVGKIYLSNNESEDRVIVNWLSPLNFFPTHDDIIRRREPGTGQWFLASPTYRAWANGEDETLWCPGIPGAGKTMLMSIVVESLRNQFDVDRKIGVACVYCNYKDQLEQTTANILAGLWRQLVHDKDAMSDDVKALYRKHADRDTRPSLDDVTEVLAKEVCRHQKVYVIVDALDECSETSRLELIEKIQKMQPTLRLLVSSRQYDSIARQFEGNPRFEIKASTNDVRAYVAGRITKGSRLERHVIKDPTLVKDIEKVVVGNAQEMFLLAQLHMDSLQSKGTPRAVRKTLETLPKDINSTYDEAMRRIGDQGDDDKQVAEQILQWISFAVRPLSLDELQEALAVEADTEKLDPDNVLDLELLTSVCCGLVIVDEKSRTIRLVHLSTQEYFKSSRSVKFPAAQEDISRTCLTYLSFDVFADGPCLDERTVISRIQKHQLFAYAAENWGEHARGAPEMVLEDQILEFLSEDEILSSSVQVMHFHPGKNWYAGESNRFAKEVTGLQLAAHFGLQHIVRKLLEDGASVLQHDSLGATALHAAAEGGHKDVAQLLLENGAQIDAQDSNGYTALHRATQTGSKPVVLLLLENGATISTGVDGRTALHFAAEFGNEVIATALLRNGADVTLKSDVISTSEHQNKFLGGRTPLHWAAATGSKALVRLLLQSGADVNAVNVTNRTPLQEAIMLNRISVVKVLLEHGASVSMKDHVGWTPLHEAAIKAAPVVAGLLLDYGAAVDATNMIPTTDLREKLGEEDRRGGWTPLHIAIRHSRYDVYEVLKNRHADVHRQDAFGLTPLHLAVKFHGGWGLGSVQIIRSLLDEGADINLKIFDRQETALHMAARQGRVDCILCLLERGADIGATNKSGKTALQVAEASGKAEAMKVLSEYRSLS